MNERSRQKYKDCGDDRGNNIESKKRNPRMSNTFKKSNSFKVLQNELLPCFRGDTKMPEKKSIGMVLLVLFGARVLRKRLSLGAKVAKAKSRVKS